jgi:hypothetical protein
MDNAISIESIVRRVTREVMAELARQGMGAASAGSGAGPNSERLDMSGYRTPLVSERAIRMVHELTGKIVVPRGAIVTPLAREAIRRKNIQVVYE